MAVTPEDLELGIKLAGLMLSRKLTQEEEQVFTFASGYGAGIKQGKQSKVKKTARPFDLSFKVDI